MIGSTTSVPSKNSKGMSIIHHHRGIILIAKIANLRKRSDVSFHRIDTVDNDQLAAVRFAELEFALQILDIIMLELQNFSKAQTTSVYD